jgi:rRNA maturation endonuclease Nob1
MHSRFLCVLVVEKEMYEMAFLDKLGETLVSAGKDVSQKAKDLSGTAKLTMDIHSKEDQLEDLYAQLGKRYFEAYSGEDTDEQIQQIRELLTVIEDMKKELQKLKGTRVCPECGEQVGSEDSFCKSCGAKLEKEDAPGDAEPAETSAQDENEITEEVFED